MSYLDSQECFWTSVEDESFNSPFLPPPHYMENLSSHPVDIPHTDHHPLLLAHVGQMDDHWITQSLSYWMMTNHYHQQYLYPAANII